MLDQSYGSTSRSQITARNPKRILVADHDPLTSKLLISVGKNEGYQIVAASDGREAHQVLKSDGNFNVAVLNIALPPKAGAAIIRYMKTEKRLMRIPVIVVCDADSLRLTFDIFAGAVIAFVSKPFKGDELVRTVRLVFNHHMPRESITLP